MSTLGIFFFLLLFWQTFFLRFSVCKSTRVSHGFASLLLESARFPILGCAWRCGICRWAALDGPSFPKSSLNLKSQPMPRQAEQSAVVLLTSEQFSTNCMLFGLTIDPVSAVINMKDPTRPPRTKQALQHKMCVEEPTCLRFSREAGWRSRSVYIPGGSWLAKANPLLRWEVGDPTYLLSSQLAAPTSSGSEGCKARKSKSGMHGHLRTNIGASPTCFCEPCSPHFPRK